MLPRGVSLSFTVILFSDINLSLPQRMFFPPRIAVTPRPAISPDFSGVSSFASWLRQYSTTLSATGCVEHCSQLPHMESISFSLILPYDVISVTEKLPFVSVPVLSNAIALTFPRASIAFPPLNSIPSFEAAPIPEKYARGTLSTRAHGQLITRKVSAEYIHLLQSPVISDGTIAVSNATAITIGV